jgi:hypothetical protein
MSKKQLFLSLLLIAVVVNNVAAIKKLKARREAEWHGLTESEVRSKLETKLPGKIPADKRGVISDKVVSKMRDRGVLGEDRAAHDAVTGTGDDTDQLAEH